MSVTQKLVTKNFNVENATSFLNSFANNDIDYFVYVGRHIPYSGGDTAIPTPTDSVEDAHYDVYDNMIFAKRLTSSDVMYMIKNNAWVANTVIYDEYSHTDPLLYEKDFYTVVNNSTEYNVYKCLFNNSNAYSTIAPSRVGSAADLEPITTGDDYVWKYMCTITKSNYEKFSSTEYVPLTANSDVISGATNGRIDIIKIVDGGEMYNNYIANASFKTGDIVVGGSGTTYGAPETASSLDNYYQGGVLKITSGAGIEQYRRIVDYSGTTLQKLFTIDRNFTITPAVNDTYQVYPYILVWGDGTETTPAEAMAIVDSASVNSISSIEILNPGAGYRKATAVVGKSPTDVPYTSSSTLIDLPSVISNDVGFKVAELTPIIPPKDGHGSDPYLELGANRICVSAKFNQTENNTISVENDFRQVGIIKNPKFHNVELIYSTGANLVGTFTVGETIKQYKQLKLLGNVSITSGNSYINKTDVGKISNTVTIVSAGVAYVNGVDTISVNNSSTNGTGFAAGLTANATGVITAVTVTNQGSGYSIPPTLTITTSTGSNAVLTAALANPQNTVFRDCFVANDYALVKTTTQNYLTEVSSVPYDDRIIGTTNSSFTATNAEISALDFTAEAIVTAVSVGQLTVSNVSGVFASAGKILGLSSGATSFITTTPQVNDKNAGSFTISSQLTRLVGNFANSSPAFEEDELVEQDTLLNIVQPFGYFHHSELGAGLDDDTLFINNESGIFNISNSVTIIGDNSTGVLDNLITKYKGDFVKDSGEVLYYENLNPITRKDNKSEIIKIILEF